MGLGPCCCPANDKEVGVPVCQRRLQLQLQLRDDRVHVQRARRASASPRIECQWVLVQHRARDAAVDEDAAVILGAYSPLPVFPR